MSLFLRAKYLTLIRLIRLLLTRTAYEVLCRGCAIKERLGLTSVLCVLDQAFYAKAVEVIWKNQDMFRDNVIMLGGFHLLMMFLGVIGTRY